MLEDYLENGRDGTPELGEIFAARVTRTGAKGAGSFVSLGDGQQGFLRDGGGLKEAPRDGRGLARLGVARHLHEGRPPLL
ncbi:MAG: hypothetical protein AAFY44_18680, partial [Pseudomonadota bacterium]